MEEEAKAAKRGVWAGTFQYPAQVRTCPQTCGSMTIALSAQAKLPPNTHAHAVAQG